MKVVVFGANGPTGRLLTTQALAEGHDVTAFTRHPDTFPIEHEHLHLTRGDVVDQASVDAAVAGQDAVLSTLGVPYSRKPISVFSEGTANIVQAMQHHGVRRLVCVTSSALDPHDDIEGGLVFRRVLQPFFIGVVGKTLYADQRRMEAIVMNSDLDWTIVRPSGLFVSLGVTDYQTGERHLRGRFTSRVDLADFMLRQLTDSRYVHKAAALTTVTGQPNFLKFLWKEGISKKAA
jgi:putative NADH-flavin reductase